MTTRTLRLAREIAAADWDPVGSGATAEEERESQRLLKAALVKTVKDPYADYKKKQYLGTVGDFFPRSKEIHPRLARSLVFWDPQPTKRGAAWTDGRSITLTKMAYKHLGSSRSLGATFIHEVEHVWDAMNGHVSEDNRLSEFTPRLRQMLRQLKDEPDFRIWNYLHRKHGIYHAMSYVDRYLEGLPADYYAPTDEEREYAVKAVQKRAKEIYDDMVARGQVL